MFAHSLARHLAESPEIMRVRVLAATAGVSVATAERYLDDRDSVRPVSRARLDRAVAVLRANGIRSGAIAPDREPRA